MAKSDRHIGQIVGAKDEIAFQTDLPPLDCAPRGRRPVQLERSCRGIATPARL